MLDIFDIKKGMVLLLKDDMSMYNFLKLLDIMAYDTEEEYYYKSYDVFYKYKVKPKILKNIESYNIKIVTKNTVVKIKQSILKNGSYYIYCMVSSDIFSFKTYKYLYSKNDIISFIDQLNNNFILGE